jgi:hypothetical protein
MTAELDQLTLKVQRILMDFLNDVRLTDDGGFMVPYQSTMVIVRPRDLGDDRTVVIVYGLVNQNVPVSPALYEWVATNTDNYMFGHIGLKVNEDGATANIVFSHTLLGDYLDPEELRNAIGAIATTSDEIDDEIQDRFGGERWMDPSGDSDDSDDSDD